MMVLAALGAVLLLALVLSRPRRHDFPEAERWARASRATRRWATRVDGPPTAAAWCRLVQPAPVPAVIPMPPSPSDDVPTAA